MRAAGVRMSKHLDSADRTVHAETWGHVHTCIARIIDLANNAFLSPTTPHQNALDLSEIIDLAREIADCLDLCLPQSEPGPERSDRHA
jgi:hypothetical protein